jgi:hypothetical protein
VSWSYEPLRATSLVTRLACSQAQGATHCVATVVLAHARPRHARSAQSSGVQRRSARRGGGATTQLCTRFHGSTVGSIHNPCTATAALKSMGGSGAPSRRSTAVLRRDGQHPGKINRATRLYVAGASQERDQGGGKDRAVAVVLTMGRRCSRGRPGVGVRVGEVGVHDGGLPQLWLLVRGRLAALPVRRGGGALPPFFSSSGARRGKGGKENPNGVSGLVTGVSASP